MLGCSFKEEDALLYLGRLLDDKPMHLRTFAAHVRDRKGLQTSRGHIAWQTMELAVCTWLSNNPSYSEYDLLSDARESHLFEEPMHQRSNASSSSSGAAPAITIPAPMLMESLPVPIDEPAQVIADHTGDCGQQKTFVPVDMQNNVECFF